MAARQFEILMSVRDKISPSLKGMKKAFLGIVKVLKRVKDRLRDMRKPFQSVLAALTGIGGLAGIFFLMGKAIRQSVVQLLEAERAAAKLRGTLKATNFTIGETERSMKLMADEMVKATTFTHEEIGEAQSILITFTQISKEMFEQALMFGADMSALFGQQLKQSIIQLGTALNDPIRGVGRLRRIGISFNEVQRLTIKLLEAQGKRFEAQQVIMDELEREIGGAAEEMAKTMGGAIEQIIGMFNSMFGVFGQMLGMFPKIKQFIFDIRDEMRGMLMGETGVTEGFIKKTFNNITMLISAITPYVGFLLDMVQGLINMALWINGAGAAFTHFGIGVLNMFKALGSGILAIPELIAKGLFFLTGHMFVAWTQFQDFIIRLGENIGATVWNFFNGIYKDLIDATISLVEKVQSVMDFLDFGLVSGMGIVLGGMVDKGLKGLRQLSQGVAQYGNELIKVNTLEETLAANELFGENMRADLENLLQTWGGGAWDTYMGNIFKDAMQHFTTTPFEEATSKMKELAAELGFETDEKGFVNLNWDKAYLDLLNGIKSAEAQLLAGLMDSVAADKALKKSIDEMNEAVSQTGHWFERTGNILAAAGFENMEDLGASIGKGVVDGGLGDLMADISSKVGGNIIGTTIQKAITDAFIEAEKLRIQKELAGSPLMEEALQNVEIEAGKKISPFAGLMGGIAGGLVSSLISGLFNKKPKVPKKPVPVKVVNWGDMTQQLLRASTRRSVSPMITSGGNMSMSRIFSEDTRF